MTESTRTPRVGNAVPALQRTIELTDMVAYAGATWDWHRMHYDRDYATGHGMPAPLIDGQLLGALLAETVQDWLGPDTRLRRLSFRFAAPVHAGATVRCAGEVVEVTDDGAIRCALRVTTVPDERVVVEPAEAVLAVR